MCFIILLGFSAISLKTEEFKLESKLCLWGSQSRTTNWNKWKSICRPLRPHVALCTHEHCYGISNASEKIHLCENIIQDKFWCVLELSTPSWLLVIRVHCGLPHLNTPEAVSNAEERTVKFHSLWEASALCWQAHFSTSPCNLNVCFKFKFICFAFRWACKGILIFNITLDTVVLYSWRWLKSPEESFNFLFSPLWKPEHAQYTMTSKLSYTQKPVVCIRQGDSAHSEVVL